MFTNKLYNNVSKSSTSNFFTFYNAIKKIGGTLMTEFSIFLGYANIESNFAGKKSVRVFQRFQQSESTCSSLNRS